MAGRQVSRVPIRSSRSSTEPTSRRRAPYGCRVAAVAGLHRHCRRSASATSHRLDGVEPRFSRRGESARFTLILAMPISDASKFTSEERLLCNYKKSELGCFSGPCTQTRTLSSHTIRAYAGRPKALIRYIGPKAEPAEISKSEYAQLLRTAARRRLYRRRHSGAVRRRRQVAYLTSTPAQD